MRSILTVVAILISYGSLFPFDFVASTDLQSDIHALFSTFSIPVNRGDLFGNIVLFIPYGLVSAMVAAPYKQRRAVIFTLFVLGMALAFVLQFVQIWLPSRDAAAGDAFINGLGLIIGLGIGSSLVHLRPTMADRRIRMALIPTSLLLLWLAYRWFPWVPTLDLQNIKNAIKPLLTTSDFNGVRAIHTAVAWLVFFKISEYVRNERIAPQWLVLVAVLINFGQLFFVGGSISMNSAVGLALAIVAMPLLNGPNALVGLSLALLATLLLSGLQPFEFATPFNTFQWIPFSGFLSGSMSTNFLVLLEKTYLYAALIFLLQKSGARPLPSTLICAAWLAVIEAFQIMVQGRTAEVTDPVFALLIGYVIAMVVRHEMTTFSSAR
ncbi:VanZ family protein [Hydrogenophaga sp.]|uniref:VanZ family protein n=1 Tax=Hydrogenophaga sp. TaxID=1904254 RepID=UPI0025C4D95B|nr:VanZ family protein [Hydrogenophaga sp.]MBT9465191.1 VanZ family protein [Hydrogenophaga sp.]